MNARSALCALACLLAVSVARAGPGPFAVDPSFTYQGVLTDGGVAANGTYDVTARMYDLLVGGAQIGSSFCANDVAVVGGLFTLTVTIGPSDLFDGIQRFIEISVRPDSGADCADAGGYITLLPRQGVLANPYALYALNAGKLGGQAASAYLLNVAPVAVTGVVPASGAIAGTNSAPDADSAGVSGEATAIEGPTVGVRGASLSVGGTGVEGVATAIEGFGRGGAFTAHGRFGTGVFGAAHALDGSATGVRGEVSGPLSVGVSGTAHATTGGATGVEGVSHSPDGAGVSGSAVAATGDPTGVLGSVHGVSGAAVRGVAVREQGSSARGGEFRAFGDGGTALVAEAVSTLGAPRAVDATVHAPNSTAIRGTANSVTGFTHGVLGLTASVDGAGVQGQALAATGVTRGVRGISASNAGIGVGALATAATGATRGVFATSQSTQGIGVIGLASATSGATIGVQGESSSPLGVGVRGVTPNGGIGVQGETTTPDGFGVFAIGRLGSTGPKPFRIDHPDDPAGRYLLHYAAESPEVINFYSGNATLDAAGGAVVELPRYFARINADPRYQLTPIGSAMPGLHVAEEVSAALLAGGTDTPTSESTPTCTFRIAGGTPGGRVSWEVKALRNDRWMQVYGAEVEVAKRDGERGTFLHPELQRGATPTARTGTREQP